MIQIDTKYKYTTYKMLVTFLRHTVITIFLQTGKKQGDTIRQSTFLQNVRKTDFHDKRETMST